MLVDERYSISLKNILPLPWWGKYVLNQEVLKQMDYQQEQRGTLDKKNLR
jgi:hypothetical protein